MKTVAIYARVSSEQQAQQATVQSQVDALTKRVAADGHVLLPQYVYVDDGVSGSTLLRPALERLRDRAAVGGIDVLYVHSPDRLARKYAYQVLLLEELKGRGVAVVFLQGVAGDGPEDQLLVQVQGMIAEYERTKIVERCRRGKLFRARQGLVSAFGRAPYGYLYVRKTAEAAAQFQVLLHDAKVVRWIFEALVQKHMSIHSIVRALNVQGTAPPGGGNRWHASAVHKILGNPTYAGRAPYGRSVPVEREPRNQLFRGASARHARHPRPVEEWIWINVPAIVSQELFDAAAEQLARNLRLSRRNAHPGRYLLQSLLVCARCGYSYSGTSHSSKGKAYTYYRCLGTIAHRWGDARVCSNASVRVDMLDLHVWRCVCDLLQDPQRLIEEWSRRASREEATQQLTAERDAATRMLAAHNRTLRRLVDAYEAGAIDLQELKRRTDGVRDRIDETERELLSTTSKLDETVRLRAIVTRLGDFGAQVRNSLHVLTWAERQRLVRTLVAKVEIGDDGATVVYRLMPPEAAEPPHPPGDGRPFVDCVHDVMLYRLTHR